MKQLSLDGMSKRSRPKRKLMHVIDAGGGEIDMRCRFKCGWCGYASGWVVVESVTEARRGVPRPKCSP